MEIIKTSETNVMRKRAFIEIESICKYFLILNPRMKGAVRAGKLQVAYDA